MSVGEERFFLEIIVCFNGSSVEKNNSKRLKLFNVPRLVNTSGQSHKYNLHS